MNSGYGELSASDLDATMSSREKADRAAESGQSDTTPSEQQRMSAARIEPNLPEAPKSKDVRTLADLIRYAYGRTGQRVAKAAVSAEVAGHLDLDPALLEELRARARNDTMLRVPWQLMAAVLREQHGQRLLERIAEVTAIAISEHPLLAARGAPSPNAILEESGEEDDVWAARRRIVDALRTARSTERAHVGRIDGREVIAAAASLPESMLTASIGDREEFTASDIQELRHNLLKTLALLFAFLDGWSNDVLTDVLHANHWKRLAETESDPPILTLTGSSEAAVAVHITDVWVNRTQQARQQAAEAQQDAERMSRHATRLQQQIDQLERERLDLRSEVERLEAACDGLRATVAERDRHLGETKAHASHDYETLRTSAIQRARRELDLLQEGLHALTRDNPKLHVTRDRLERAIEGLEKEVEHLKGGMGT